MRASLYTLAASSAAVHGAGIIDARATAHCDPGNNCQRGVAGTAGNNPPLSSRMADCSSFMLTTITPAPTTVTTTITLAPEEKRGIIAERQVTVTPSSVPAYATYCPNEAAYSSACSCAGVTAMTTTAPTPTVTATATYCPDTMCGSVCADLTADNNNCGSCGNVCGSGTTCVNSVCLPTCSNPANCDSSSVCDDQCGFCLPDVSTDVSVCISNGECDGCTSDSDCTAAPGGICLSGCCGTGCVYPDQLCGFPGSKRDKVFGVRDGNSLVPGGSGN